VTSRSFVSIEPKTSWLSVAKPTPPVTYTWRPPAPWPVILRRSLPQSAILSLLSGRLEIV